MKSPSDFSAMDFSAAFDSMNPAKFLESMQQVQQAWSTMGVSAGLTPTMDLEEIDKRIANLKAVEQWLNLNLTMLQSSVQALQVQRSTIATLNNLGESLGTQSGPLSPESIKKAMAKAGANSTAQTTTNSSATPLADPMAWFDMLQKQFLSIASNTVGSPVGAPSSASTTSKSNAKAKTNAKAKKAPVKQSAKPTKKSGTTSKRKPRNKSKPDN